MKTQHLYLLAILILFCACSTGKSVVQTKPAYPVFPGGEDSLQSFLKAQIHFPDTLLRNRIVHANCEIDSLGKVTSSTVWGYKSEECELLVENALKQMPEWILTEKDIPSTGAKCAFLFKFIIPGLEEQQSNIEEDPECFRLNFYKQEFPGGIYALEKFMQKELGSPLPVRLGRKGDVIARFTINKDGLLMPMDPTIIKGLGKRHNRKVIKALQMMPRWKPGVSRGAQHRCTWEMTLSFGGRKYPKFTCQLVDIIMSYHFSLSADDPVFEKLPKGPFQNYLITIEKE
ncbi:energy transducer TonB [Bacteroides sp. 519]|uniref:energy transducer TonB n=1 Tax=Bacteroides sp. 519 TaxID=2302937 RepID=UPI0013D4DA35|nr:hypothetical protein [Bacteroides sp. 519]